MGKTTAREIVDFNADWHFHLGGELPKDVVSYGNMGLISDETRIWQKADNHGLTRPKNPHVDSWRMLDVPHDFVVEGRYSHDSSPNNGSLPHDKAWYVKKFELPAADEGRRISIEFDGVFRDCQVWMNGHFIGRHLSGYTSFGFDVTEVCCFGALNSVGVYVDASENELWSYEGGGIYRSVRLVKTSPIHIAYQGVGIQTGGADDPGVLFVDVSVVNASYAGETVEISCKALSHDGKPVGNECVTKLDVSSTETAAVRLSIRVHAPQLWSLESPVLYSAVVELKANGEILDSLPVKFGFRYFNFDPATGFHLNGKSIKLKGVCCHQDHAGVGVAVPPALQEWRARRLKELGCNAIRTSHNPPDPAFLDACDRLGMLVMDEQRIVGASGEILKQLESLIRRDRNHPSVIIWSLGNEEMGIHEVFGRLDRGS